MSESPRFVDWFGVGPPGPWPTRRNPEGKCVVCGKALARTARFCFDHSEADLSPEDARWFEVEKDPVPKEGIDFVIEEQFEITFAAETTIRVWAEDKTEAVKAARAKLSSKRLDWNGIHVVATEKVDGGKTRKATPDGKPFCKQDWLDARYCIAR